MSLMTKEDAIKILNTVLVFNKCDCSKEEIEECLKMAIKALEQKPCEYAPFTINELKDENMQKLLREFKNQRVIVTDNNYSPSVTIIEPCEDCISREAVLEQTYNWSKDEFLRVTNPFDYLRKRINNLPSVTPKIKTGHWIMLDECVNSGYYCSECRKKVVKDGWSDTVKKIKYCPNCGKKMVEPTCRK